MQAQIAVFGAGHVGRALVPLLASLPCRVRWIDSREQEFASHPPDGVTKILSDEPVDEVAKLPSGSYCLVMTHNHQLDFELTAAILKRNDFLWFGLIGSKTKRIKFEYRLRERGFDATLLQRMRCPMGLAEVRGKLPMEIAVSIAAEIKSRFVTLAAAIGSAVEAQSFIQTHSDLNASHNCWAWKLDDQYRSHDDGEPGGTAGRPILAAIEAQDCDQVVVLVIRWYGGIQLGVGLARADGTSANKCLQQAEKRLLISRVPLPCSCSFSELALLKLRVAQLDGLILSENFTASGVDLKLAVSQAAIATLHQQLADLSRGRIVLQEI